jgi:predicted membrane-bound dolichyl-phosphate-mannose-protein mannosyltransferase
MKPNYIVLTVVLLVSTSFFGLAQNEKTETDKTSVSEQKIEVYYFHNTRRCATCQAVEAVTKRTLEENYPEQMKDGMIAFQSLNIEEDVNEPLARELHVSGQTLLFVKDGKKKDLTNDAFMYARTNPEKFQEKIIETLDNL